MRARSLVRSLPAGLSLLAALSCGQPTAPLNTGGTYALVRVAGDALPAQTLDNGYVRIASIADTLRFRPDGTGTSVSVERVQQLPDAAPTVVRFEGTFRYSLDGTRVEIAFVCGPLANCVAPPHMVGRSTANGIRFTFVLTSRVPQDYDRVEAAP